MITMDTIRRLVIFAAVAAAVCILVAGCGGDESTSTEMQPSRKAPNGPPTEPAITQQIGFDEIAFDSPVKQVKDAQGLVFLHFTYTEADGKVYKCELPRALSLDPMAPSEWLTTFKVYKLPEVVAQKKKGTVREDLAGLPLISPKPETPKVTTEKPDEVVLPKVNLPNMPQMPSTPTAPGTSSGVPGAGPTVPDYSKLPAPGGGPPSSNR